MRRVSDRAGSAEISRVTIAAVLPSACYNSVGTPELLDFAAQWLACTYPCQRFACALTAADA